MRKIISFIPNLLTLCNLMCGLWAIIFAFDGNFVYSFWMIITAAVFDFCDGFAARLLNARSDIGMQLDSLSDVVSFGVAPAFMATFATMQFFAPLGYDNIFYGCLLLAPFASYRLAVFNVDTTQSEEFKGLPTPAMALFIASLSAYILPNITASMTWMVAILAVVLLFCILMVSRIPMFSFKFKNFSLKKNIVRYLFAIISVLIVIFTGIYTGIGLIIGLYILTSIVLWITFGGKKA